MCRGIIYLTDRACGLLSHRDRVANGSLRLSLFGLSRFFPRLRALVDLGLRHAYYLFRELAEAFKGFWVWRFSFFSHLRANVIIRIIVSGICYVLPLTGKCAVTESSPVLAFENIFVCDFTENEKNDCGITKSPNVIFGQLLPIFWDTKFLLQAPFGGTRLMLFVGLAASLITS